MSSPSYHESMPGPTACIRPRAGLADLAGRIDAEHAAVATALQSALAHAIAAGELLIEAKRKAGLIAGFEY